MGLSASLSRQKWPELIDLYNTSRFIGKYANKFIKKVPEHNLQAWVAFLRIANSISYCHVLIVDWNYNFFKVTMKTVFNRYRKLPEISVNWPVAIVLVIFINNFISFFVSVSTKCGSFFFVWDKYYVAWGNIWSHQSIHRILFRDYTFFLFSELKNCFNLISTLIDECVDSLNWFLRLKLQSDSMSR